jgi:calcium-dependent protein kinase
VDIDGNGEIDYTEFLAASADMQFLLSRENLRNTFNFFDKDRSGQISISELRNALNLSESESMEKELQQAIRKVDNDGDGEISLEEFTSMM